MKTLFTFLAVLIAFSLSAQTTYTQPTTGSEIHYVNSGDIFADDGGCEGNYSDNVSSTTTFYPGTAGEKLTVTFDSWNVEDGVLEWGAAQPGKTINIHNRMIINPGSVGQPRDYDPRAAYGIYHTNLRRFEFKRVEYDIAAVQKKIFDNKMPARQAERLAGGW